jgi:nicotinamide-nucleotide amidase
MAMPAPRARLLLTGDELLRGFIQDANSGFLAAELRDLGIELDQIRIVGDEHEVIVAALDEARTRDGIDLVVVCGGLGPTHDDRTSEAVAGALGRELELREDALAVVEARIRAFGRMRTAEEVASFTPGNRKQATMPRGATWADPLGTAPGYVVADEDERAIVVLPGPPSELRHAWRGLRETTELRTLAARVGTRHERLLRVWGVPESRASEALAGTGHEDSPERRVTICARDGELEIAVRGSDVEGVDALVDELGSQLGARVFAIDDHRDVVEIVAAHLLGRGWWLATAESCTGGMLGAMVTAMPGSSTWYRGGAVAYSNELKASLVGVDPELIEREGAVSEAVARALASGAAEHLGAEVGVGITGVAGPGGGTEDKPVGTVHVAIATPLGVVHRALRMPGDRDTIRRRSCTIALHELRIALETPA